jgi:hypothetical protein
MARKRSLRLPVVTLGAEHLVMGHLMRRNILAYKAPPNNEGYDILCIHPDPKKLTRQVRVQVKSRYQTDCDRAFLVKEQSLAACDFVIGVFQNIGHFFHRRGKPGGQQPPEFYTLPRDFVRAHHAKAASGFDKLRTRKLNLERFKNEQGFELIARKLGIHYPHPLKNG